VINDLDGERLTDVASGIGANGGSAGAVQGSGSDWSVAERIVTTCLEDFGGLDRIVNTAGVWDAAAPWEETESVARAILETNGIALSADGRRLIVAEWRTNRTTEFKVDPVNGSRRIGPR
jgi:NAD(P)-dependent dehydrogenase (short-subunit alcohol dehydrogenase family)